VIAKTRHPLPPLLLLLMSMQFQTGDMVPQSILQQLCSRTPC
jgi:hypothetical protein